MIVRWGYYVAGFLIAALVWSVSNVQAVIALPTQPAWVPPIGNYTRYLNYLALGDSFSSGEGELTDGYYLLGTNQPLAKCHTSTRSYPYLVAQYQSVPHGVRSVACSGARVTDIASSTSYRGQADRLAAQTPSLYSQQAGDALQWFTPGVVRQIDFVARYHPRAVSVGIGGNDVSLFDKLKACLMPLRCNWTQGNERVQMAREIRALFPSLTDLYSALRRASSETRFYVVDYPQIINPWGYACDSLLNHLLDNAERVLLYETIDYLNEVIRAAARWAGFKFVSVENAFVGKRLCDADASAMNGIRFGDDTRIVGVGDVTIMLGNESFHPTPVGHLLIARIINTSLRIDVPQGGAVSGLERTKAPPIPSYWQDDGRILPRLVAYPVQVQETIIGGNSVRIILSAGSFAASSRLTVTIRSEERVLAYTTATDQGGLAVDVSIPVDMEEGYHTLSVKGVDADQLPIEYYQIVHLQQPDPVAARPQQDTSQSGQQVLAAVDEDSDHHDHLVGGVSGDDSNPGSSLPNIIVIGAIAVSILIVLVVIIRIVRQKRHPP